MPPVLVHRILVGLFVTLTAAIGIATIMAGFAYTRHPGFVPLYLLFQGLFLFIGLVCFVWDELWRRGDSYRFLRAPVLSPNSFRIILLLFLLGCIGVSLWDKAKFSSGEDTWIFAGAPYVFGAVFLLLVTLSVREWNKPTERRHSLWNAMFFMGTLIGMLVPLLRHE